MIGKREGEYSILYVGVCGTEVPAQVSTAVYQLPNSHFQSENQSISVHAVSVTYTAPSTPSPSVSVKAMAREMFTGGISLRGGGGELQVSGDNALSRTWATRTSNPGRRTVVFLNNY